MEKIEKKKEFALKSFLKLPSQNLLYKSSSTHFLSDK